MEEYLEITNQELLMDNKGELNATITNNFLKWEQ